MIEDGTHLDGEAAWRAALAVADPEQLEVLRAALPGDELEDDQGDDPAGAESA